MKSKKKKEQFQIANVLYEMGMDFDVIETISGVTPQELLMDKIDLIEYHTQAEKVLMSAINETLKENRGYTYYYFDKEVKKEKKKTNKK